MRAPGRMLPRLAAALLAVPAAAADAVRRDSVRITSPVAAIAVERALTGARRRLDRPKCQRVFTRFQDRDGRPLSDRLQELGASGGGHLGSLLFYDGSRIDRCRNNATILAMTHVGGRVVFVCEAFVRAARRDPLLAEAALIHESLHTLGLAENPPSSAEITATVIAACAE